VDKKKAAMVPDGVYPSHEENLFSHAGGGQICAIEPLSPIHQSPRT
jgi:hypothetical protein